VIEKVKTTKSKLVPQRQVSLFSSIKGLVWHEVNSLPVVELEGTVICHGIVTDIIERLEEEQNRLKSIDCIHSLARLIRLLFALLMKKCF
jgi:predicted transcriptional regulator